MPRSARTISQLAQLPETVEMQDTYWGVILREVEPVSSGTGFWTWTLRGLALACLLVALGQYLPGAVVFADVIAFKLSLAGAFLGTAFLFWKSSRPKDRAEVHFDTERREIRYVVKGRSKSISGFAMDHVSALIVDPIIQGSEYAEMRLYFDGMDEGMLVVSGLRSELGPVATRLRRDMTKPSVRVERRMSQAA